MKTQFPSHDSPRVLTPDPWYLIRKFGIIRPYTTNYSSISLRSTGLVVYRLNHPDAWISLETEALKITDLGMQSKCKLQNPVLILISQLAT